MEGCFISRMNPEAKHVLLGNSEYSGPDLDEPTVAEGRDETLNVEP